MSRDVKVRRCSPVWEGLVLFKWALQNLRLIGICYGSCCDVKHIEKSFMLIVLADRCNSVRGVASRNNNVFSPQEINHHNPLHFGHLTRSLPPLPLLTISRLSLTARLLIWGVNKFLIIRSHKCVSKMRYQASENLLRLLVNYVSKMLLCYWKNRVVEWTSRLRFPLSLSLKPQWKILEVAGERVKMVLCTYKYPSFRTHF